MVRYMCSFSDQFQSVMAVNFPPTSGVDGSTHRALTNMHVVEHRLKTRGYREKTVDNKKTNAGASTPDMHTCEHARCTYC